MRTTGAHVRIEPTAGVSSGEQTKQKDSAEEHAGDAENEKNGNTKTVCDNGICFHDL